MCISKKITEKLIAKGIIEERKYGADVYEYGIELILGDLINYILIRRYLMTFLLKFGKILL